MVNKRSGFTLAEVLLVLAIIMILLVLGSMNIKGQIDRANDSKRKSDLTLLNTAFEAYKNDHGTYPDASAISTCGDTALAPYIATIPCDPQGTTAYGYFPSALTGGYRLCTILRDTEDPAIAKSNCSGPDGCGLGGGFNYCLANGTTASAVGTSDQAPGVPTSTVGVGGPTPTMDVRGFLGCSPLDPLNKSYCKSYSNDKIYLCAKTYPIGSACNNECNTPQAVLCLQDVAPSP